MSTTIGKAGYAGFGSFMIETSVEELITRDADTYKPPAIPFSTPDLDLLLASLSTSTELGSACRHLFQIDFKQWTFLNHGAFGAVCVPAHMEACAWRDHCERQPLHFLDRDVLPQLVRVMREMAAHVHCEPQVGFRRDHAPRPTPHAPCPMPHAPAGAPMNPR